MPLTRWFLLATTMLLIQQPALAKECIGVISAGSGNHFWRAVESGARKAGSEFGYEIFYRTPPNESAIKEQGQQLTDAIKRGCVAIVLAPNSPTRITEIQAFNSQHTPVVIIDRDMQLEPVYAKVMTDTTCRPADDCSPRESWIGCRFRLAARNIFHGRQGTGIYRHHSLVKHNTTTHDPFGHRHSRNQTQCRALSESIF